MLVNEFLEKVGTYKTDADGKLSLLFELASGRRVQGGYHITEIKNVVHETIDCGNSLHRWKEVVLQVWVPEQVNASATYMTTTQFMKIWDAVDSRLSLYKDAEIKVEYGDGECLTSIYHLDAIVPAEDGLIVQMVAPRTLCKPREALIELNQASQNAAVGFCCAPANRQETVIPLQAVNAQTQSNH